MEGDLKHIFFTNLQLLGMDMTSMERKYKIQFNKDMFNFPNKPGSEAVLYFLFNRLNSTLCQQMFRDCWPVTDKKSEAQFRKLCCSWLHNVQKEEADSRLPRINASLFLSPGGDKFCRLLFSLSTYVIRHVTRTENGVDEADMMGYPVLTQQNKELGPVMEATLKCAAIRHRRRFLDTLALTAVAKQGWQNSADEMTQSLRGMKKKTRDVEREKRQHIQTAAQQAEARGSPVPASRSFHDFDVSEHTANRAQRLQKVRGLWKEVEGYVEASREEQIIINSIIDKTLEKHAIDAAHIQISIPHLMLCHCQQEIQRRQVENIYEGGELNLISVMQLWNMALRMYIERLKEDGLKDLSDEVAEMRAQAHSHQAFLANTTLLREKLSREVPHRKKVVAKLRSQFCDEETASTGASGLEMSAPSPAMNFDLPRGHSGATPTGPAVQMYPAQGQGKDTPEAVADLARLICGSSGRPLVESFQARAFGLSGLQNRNQNNSARSVQPSKPTIQKSGIPGSSQGGRPPQQQQQSGRSTGRGRGGGGGGVQPRVVRHFSRQSAVPPASSAHKKSAPGRGKGSSSSPEKTPRGARQRGDHDTTPVPSAPSNNSSNSSTVVTGRERAHNLLADKIVWAVMHGEEEEDGRVGGVELGLTSDPRTFDPVASFSGDTTLTPKSSPPQTPVRRAARTAHDTSRSSARDPPQASDLPSQHAVRTSNRSGRELADSGDMADPFLRATSPVTLVQQQEAWTSGADNWGDAHSGDGVQRKRREGDGGPAEAEDVNIEDPIAALSEEAFESLDLIGRSPLAMEISRMWRDAISDDTEQDPGSSDQAVGSGWLDSDRSDLSTARFLTPRAQRSSDVNEPWPASQLDTSDRSAASSQGVSARPGVRADEEEEEEGQILRSAGAAVDGCVERRSGGEDRSPPSAVHRKEEEEEEEEEDSSPQTMINRTMAFVTSFNDDDDDEDSARQVGDEDHILEWEERLSALYGGEDSPELSDSDSHEPFSAAALGGLFDDRTSATGEADVPTSAVGSSGVGGGVSGSLTSPAVALTPQMSQQGSWAERSPTVAGDGDMLRETSRSGQWNAGGQSPAGSGQSGGSSGKSPVRAGQKSVRFSPPGGSWDREPRGHVAGGAGSVAAPPSDRPRPAPVGGPSPRDASSAGGEGGIFDVTPPEMFADDDDDDEGLVSPGASSPCNESFTPLRWGMLVQGKSPNQVQGKSPSLVQGKSPALSALDASSSSSSCGLFSDSGAGRAQLAAVSQDSLDQQLAAQLSKLRRMKAAAFKDLDLGGGGGGGAGDRGKNGEQRAGAAISPPVPTASSSSAPTPPRSTEQVGKEELLPTQGSDLLDIFGEDDTLLLPASP